jgi:hypothetical protein
MEQHGEGVIFPDNGQNLKFPRYPYHDHYGDVVITQDLKSEPLFQKRTPNKRMDFQSEPLFQKRISNQGVECLVSDTYHCNCRQYRTDDISNSTLIGNLVGGKNLKTLTKCSRSGDVKRFARKHFVKEMQDLDRQRDFKQRRYLIANDSVGQYVDTGAIQLQYLKHLDDRSRKNVHVEHDSGICGRRNIYQYTDKNRLEQENPGNPWIPVFHQLNEYDKILVYEAIISLMHANEQQ